MQYKLGLGLLTVGMLAWHSAAHAVTVDYTGLAFNSQSPFYSYSRIADEAGDLAWGGSQLNQAPTIGAGLGQAVYSVTGTSIDATGGLTGGSIDFGASTVGMDFAGNTMFITGGRFDIKANDGWTGPTQPLPFGLGAATPDYELENGYLDVTLNGVAMSFSLCESILNGSLCTGSGNDEPWSGFQPYNTLNVGDVGGDTDLAMFVYLRGECDDESCPFYQPTTYSYRVCEVRRSGGLRNCFTTSESYCRQFDIAFNQDNQGILTGGAQMNTMVGTGGGFQRPKPKKCKITENEADSDIYMKLALWGSEPVGPGPDPEIDTPEPATMSLLSLGLVGLGAAVRRRRQAA